MFTGKIEVGWGNYEIRCSLHYRKYEEPATRETGIIRICSWDSLKISKLETNWGVMEIVFKVMVLNEIT